MTMVAISIGLFIALVILVSILSAVHTYLKSLDNKLFTAIADGIEVFSYSVMLMMLIDFMWFVVLAMQFA